MASETQSNETAETNVQPNDATATDVDGVEVQAPEFQSLPNQDLPGKPQEISRFADIKVTVSAELGRAEVPIQKLLSLGTGSVLEMNRTIDSPVELVAQGVPLASGEVVVVDGCFAIRIIEVYPRNRRGEELKVEPEKR